MWNFGTAAAVADSAEEAVEQTNQEEGSFEEVEHHPEEMKKTNDAKPGWISSKITSVMNIVMGPSSQPPNQHSQKKSEKDDHGTPPVESQDEYYARKERERQERDAARRKLAEEEERKEIYELMEKTRQREIQDGANKKAAQLREIEEARERAIKEEAARKELEAHLKAQQEQFDMQRAETERIAQLNIQGILEEKNRMIEENEKQAREKALKDAELSKQLEQEHRWKMEQLQSSNRATLESLSAASVKVAADAAATADLSFRQLEAVNKGQILFELKSDQLKKDLEKTAIEEQTKTSQFLQEVDRTKQAQLQGMEKIMETQVAQSRDREKDRGENKRRYEEEHKLDQDKKDQEIREAERKHQESTEHIKRETHEEMARKELELETKREAHKARMEELQMQEKEAMEEMNVRRQKMEEERNAEWNKRRAEFVEMIRKRFVSMWSNEVENMWDDRFNQLRRSQDPVKECFNELQCVSFNYADAHTSLIRFGGRLGALRIALATLEETMSSEREQVEIWKEQQPGAFFLVDIGDALDTILKSIESMGVELNKVSTSLQLHQDNAQELERVFKLHSLETAFFSMEAAVDAIPNVYQLNKKYRK